MKEVRSGSPLKLLYRCTAKRWYTEHREMTRELFLWCIQGASSSSLGDQRCNDTVQTHGNRMVSNILTELCQALVGWKSWWDCSPCTWSSLSIAVARLWPVQPSARREAGQPALRAEYLVLANRHFHRASVLTPVRFHICFGINLQLGYFPWHILSQRLMFGNCLYIHIICLLTWECNMYFPY